MNLREKYKSSSWQSINNNRKLELYAALILEYAYRKVNKKIKKNWDVFHAPFKENLCALVISISLAFRQKSFSNMNKLFNFFNKKKIKTFLILKLIPIYISLFFSFWLSGDVQRDIDMLTQDFRLSYGKIYIDFRIISLFVKLVHRKLCRLSWKVANFNKCSFIQID